jgi:hypothetical protein
MDLCPPSNPAELSHLSLCVYRALDSDIESDYIFTLHVLNVSLFLKET